MGTVAQLFDSLAETLNDISRDEIFGVIECKAKDLSKCQEYKQSRKRKYAKLFSDYSSSSDAFDGQNSNANCRFQTFLLILTRCTMS